MGNRLQSVHVRPLDARGLRIGLALHALVVFAAGTSLARGSGFFDALGLLLLAAAVAGYATGRVADSSFDAAHTAFVAGTIGGLLAATVFVVGVRADATTGVYWQLHYALATVGLPSWLVEEYGELIVIVVGLLLGTAYAFSTLAGGGVAAGDVVQVEESNHPEERP